MKTKLFLLVLWCFSTVLCAQTAMSTYHVKGILLDSVSNEPVAYATIGIAYKEKPQKAVKMFVTDTKGRFSELLPGAGKYIITLSSVGNRSVVHDFCTKEAEKVVDLGILYTRESVEELGGVTVLAQKPLVKVDVDKIAYDVESDPDAEAKTVLDMLRKVPLITVDGDDNIKLNGKSNFRVHLNGRPSNLLSNNPGKTLKSMPANSVKDIEVITSPGAKYDAEGVGGIINIVTLSGKGLEGYTTTFSGGANTEGGWNAGLNAMLKMGKLSVSGNYTHYYHTSKTFVNTNTEYFTEKDNHFLNTNLGSRYRQPMDFGSAEASYEIDSLNLLTFTVSSYGGHYKQNQDSYSEMLKENGDINYHYRMNGLSRQNFGGTEVSFNYQRTLGQKDELLTASYRYSHNPSGGSSYQHIFPLEGNVPFGYSEQNNNNDAFSNEHTVQLDYVNPFNKMHTLEAGFKYIYRNNSSESTYERRMKENDPWTPVLMDLSSFDHNQYILSVYAAYTLKYKNFGLKAGARLEQSRLKAYLHSEKVSDFDANFTDVIPTGNLSLKLSDTKTLRAGYNLRISRPGIWYLNPYRDEENPHYVSFGNPYLDSEKYHNVDLNFSSFTQKLMINASLSYNFCRNSIQNYSELNESTGKLESTYGNIGKQQSVNLGLYANATLGATTSVWMNGMLNYVDLRSKELDATAKGWQWGGSIGVQQKLPWKIQLSAYGGYYGPDIQLQSKSVSYYYYGLNLNRSFLKEERLTITLFANSFLNKYMSMKSSTFTKDFNQNTEFQNKQRYFGINISYRIGDLRTTVKKVTRGIVNDDLKSGGGDAKQSKE